MSRAPKHQPRRAGDAYYTPDSLAEACVNVVPAWGSPVILEPSVGGGAFVRAARKRWADCTVHVRDIDPRARGLDLGDQATVGDFLDSHFPGIDAVIMNPPYSFAVEHIQHALGMCPRVGALVRMALMESKARIGFWRTSPLACAWVLAERPSFTGRGTDAAAYAWLWFDRTHEGPAAIVPGWDWSGARQRALL